MIRNIFHLTLLSFLFVCHLQAQKLPGKQEASLHAPANTKIDGKTSEWGNKFQAYNNTTELYYTIANNDSTLYLSVKCTDLLMINKIVSAGISFTIIDNDKKSEGITVSYPVFTTKTKPNIGLKDRAEIISGPNASANKADSAMKVNNKHFTERSKYIKIFGVKGLDTLISVYNDDGIKAAALFDNDLNYNYEVAIDLKLFKKNIGPKLYYKIRVNEITNDNINGVTIEDGPNGMPRITFSPGFVIYPREQRNAYFAPVDFSGEYILVK